MPIDSILVTPLSVAPRNEVCGLMRLITTTRDGREERELKDDEEYNSILREQFGVTL